MNEQDTGGLGGLSSIKMSMSGPDMAGTDQIEQLASQPVIDPANKWLRYAAASIAPTRGGSFGESFANSLDAYAGANEREAELRAKYLPIIAQALLQRQMQAVTIQQNQAKMTKDWDATLVGGLTGLMSSPTGVNPQSIREMAIARVRQGQVPEAFAAQWLNNVPKDPTSLGEWARGRAISVMGDDARLGAASAKIEMRSPTEGTVPFNANPNAPQPVGPMPGGTPSTLKPADALPTTVSTPAGLRSTFPTLGKSAIAGTPEAQALTQEALGGTPGTAPGLPPGAPGRPGGAPSTSAAEDPARREADKTYADEYGKYKSELDNKVSALADLNSRIAESRSLVKDFRPGASGEMRTRIASWVSDLAQTMGLSQAQVDSITAKVAQGDVSSAQAFQKLAVQGAMEALKAAMGPGQRMAVAEFQQFSTVGNPNLNTDPRAMEKIQNFLAEQYRKSLMEQDYLTKEYARGAPLNEIRNSWSQMQSTKNPPARVDNAAMGATRKGSPPTTTTLGVSNSGRKMKMVDGQWEYE